MRPSRGRARATHDKAFVLEQASGDEKLQGDIERLLRSSARRFKLDGRLKELYLDFSWRSRSRNARTWLATVTIINLFIVPIDYCMNPVMVGPGILLRGLFIPIVYVAIIRVWKRPSSTHVEGLAITIFVTSMMLIAGILGIVAGGSVNERYAVACLFVVSTGIHLIPLEYMWSVIASFAICGCYLGFQLHNPQNNSLVAILMTIFFGTVIAALTEARWVANVFDQRDVLMQFRNASQVRRLAMANKQLHELASIDALTGLLNRRSINELLEKACDVDTCHQVAVAMIDIDHFKILNDTLGHAEGDRCLRLVVGGLNSAIRPHVDLLGRIGGEEFLLILPDSSEDTAMAVCEQLCRAVEALGIANPRSPTKPVATISIGVAAAATLDRVNWPTAEVLVAMADKALYDAKHAGRNRVSGYSKTFTSYSSNVSRCA